MTCCCCSLSLLKTVILFFYPACQTYRIVKGQEKEGQSTLWGYYWVFYSVFALLELLTFGLFEMIPFYGLIKAVFCLWMYHTDYKGALLLAQFFKPGFQTIIEKAKPLTDKFEPFAN